MARLARTHSRAVVRVQRYQAVARILRRLRRDGAGLAELSSRLWRTSARGCVGPCDRRPRDCVRRFGRRRAARLSKPRRRGRDVRVRRAVDHVRSLRVVQRCGRIGVDAGSGRSRRADADADCLAGRISRRDLPDGHGCSWSGGIFACAQCCAGRDRDRAVRDQRGLRLLAHGAAEKHDARGVDRKRRHGRQIPERE